MINFLSVAPNQKLSLQLSKIQRYNINLSIIRKMSNNESKKISIFDLKPANIRYQKSGQLDIKKDMKKQNLLRDQIQQIKIAVKVKEHEQQKLQNNFNIGFRQQFISEVKKRSNMILIYDLKNKNEPKSLNKKRKLKIQDQQSTQFYPRSKRRYKTLNDYCQNLPLSWSEGNEVIQHSKGYNYQQKTQKHNEIKQFNRYVKLSKLKDLKADLYKNESRNQRADENVLISKSKSEGRSQIPTPSNIIIQNLRNYMKKKKEKFLPILQSDMLKNDHRRNNKEFFSKNFIPHQQSFKEHNKKIQLPHVNNIFKCSSITIQSNRNFDRVELQTPENLYDGQQDKLKKEQSSNLIRNRKSQKFYTLDSKNIRNGNNRREKRQSFGTSRIENQQQILKNEQIHRRRHYNLEGDQRRRARLKQLSKETIFNEQNQLIKQKMLGIIKKQKYEYKIFTDRKQQNEEKMNPKDQYNEQMLNQSINQWPFKSTSSEHFNQYFFSQKQKLNV